MKLMKTIEFGKNLSKIHKNIYNFRVNNHVLPQDKQKKKKKKKYRIFTSNLLFQRTKHSQALAVALALAYDNRVSGYCWHNITPNNYNIGCVVSHVIVLDVAISQVCKILGQFIA